MVELRNMLHMRNLLSHSRQYSSLGKCPACSHPGTQRSANVWTMSTSEETASMTLWLMTKMLVSCLYKDVILTMTTTTNTLLTNPTEPATIWTRNIGSNGKSPSLDAVTKASPACDWLTLFLLRACWPTSDRSWFKSSIIMLDSFSALWPNWTLWRKNK